MICKIILASCVILFTSNKLKGNEIVIKESKKFDTVFSAKIIYDKQNDSNLLVIDRIIKGKVDAKMLDFAKNFEKLRNNQSQNILFMFYPDGSKSFESHAIDSKGGFSFRLHDHKHYCLLENLISGLSE